mgnify:CR=1 FL=1
MCTGILIVRATRRTWRKLAALEHDSAAFQKWTANRWVKVSSFVFVGGIKGKKSYDKRHTLAERTANREKVEAVQRRLKGHRD